MKFLENPANMATWFKTTDFCPKIYFRKFKDLTANNSLKSIGWGWTLGSCSTFLRFLRLFPAFLPFGVRRIRALGIAFALRASATATTTGSVQIEKIFLLAFFPYHNTVRFFLLSFLFLWLFALLFPLRLLVRRFLQSLQFFVYQLLLPQFSQWCQILCVRIRTGAAHIE